MNGKKTLVLYSVLSLVLGFLLCWIFIYHILPSSSKMQINNTGLRLSQKDYPLISQLLLCNIDGYDYNRDKILENTVRRFVSDRIYRGLAENMSVFIINYKNGQWLGVNENERYDPASLLKVPLMIAYFKYVQTNPKILEESTSYEGDDQNNDEYFKSSDNIKPGRLYSINELIKSMIVNSDNTAAILLQNYIDKNFLMNIFTDLGLPTPSFNLNVEYISAKSYSYFFRILYNKTYLNKELSEKALEILVQSKNSIIHDGLPQGITVAQKFGERSFYDPNNVLKDRELHDCGIIYKPDSPYLLCVMSRGKNFDDMKKNIIDLSALVYKNISSDLAN